MEASLHRRTHCLVAVRVVETATALPPSATPVAESVSWSLPPTSTRIFSACCKSFGLELLVCEVKPLQ